MRTVIITFLFGLAISAFADEYRSFTDKKGRTIQAIIIKVNKGEKNVTIERDNNKKITVPISVFSEADQDYINAWSPFKKEAASEVSNTELNANQTTLSKDQVKDIGARYIKMLEKYHTHPKKSFFCKPLADHISTNSSPGGVAYRSPFKDIEQIRLDDYSEKYFSFEITYTSKETGYNNSSNITETNWRPDLVWALLAPDGQIKYESAFYPHPVEELVILLARASSPRTHYRLPIPIIYTSTMTEQFTELLQDCGAPSFSMEDDSFRFSNLKKKEENALEVVIDWLIENGTNIDTTEPKVYYPKDAFEQLEPILIKIKREL